MKEKVGNIVKGGKFIGNVTQGRQCSRMKSRTKSKDEALAILTETYNLVEEGWCKGSGHRKIGGIEHRCLSNSLHHARVNLFGDSQFEAGDQASACLLKAIGPDYSGIVEFNDSCHDKRQVLRVVEKAIELSRKG